MLNLVKRTYKHNIVTLVHLRNVIGLWISNVKGFTMAFCPICKCDHNLEDGCLDRASQALIMSLSPSCCLISFKF